MPLIQLQLRAGDIAEAVDAFIVNLHAQGRSEHTVAAYRRDLNCFIRALPVCLHEITPATIDVALTHPTATHSADGTQKSTATMHRLKATLRSFFEWAHNTGLVESNPARFVKMKRLARTLPKFLTEAEKRRLLKELRDRTDPLARRDRVIFEIFLGTGIRLAELVNLDIDDIDLDGKHMRITGKGGIPQVKFLKTSLRTLLRSYLKERRKLADEQNAALFLSSRGTRICGRQVEGRLRHWLAKASIQKRVTPHGLRHTFATHLYAKTSDLLLVKRAMVHADISTTEIYTHLADDALEEALERV
ncbi:MAG: tyrosine-type recombinase/integrase [Armatimonadota bacterium]|nr:tyrosine-type recombinase/integrase [bacterium]